MSQTHLVGLIQDPGIMKKEQCIYRITAAAITIPELPEIRQVRTGIFTTRANEAVLGLLTVDEKTTIDLNKCGVGTFEEKKSVQKFQDGLFCIYKRAYVSAESGTEVRDITPEMEEKYITKEVEKMLKSEFNEIVNRTDFPQELAGNVVSVTYQNNFVRGGTVISFNPQTPIEDPELREIQESLYRVVDGHVDLNSPSSFTPSNLTVKEFSPTSLESVYKAIADGTAKIKKIYNNGNNNLSENDNVYCEQAKDNNLYLNYLSAQMTTLVDFEKRATSKDIIKCGELLFQNPNGTLDATAMNNLNNVVLAFNKSSADFTQNLFYLSNKLGKTTNETEDLCKSSILESSKSAEIKRCGLENANMEDQTERGKVDAIPYNPNARYQRYVFCNFFDCGKNIDQKNVDEANMLVKKFIKVINNSCPENKNIESKIDELSDSNSPVKILQKKKLENELNESNRKLNEVANSGYYFNTALSKISDNKNQNKENINKDFLSVMNNPLIDDLAKIEKVIVVFCDSDISKNYVGVLSSVLSNKNLSDKDKIEFFNHLHYMCDNGIEQSQEEFSNLCNGVNSVTKTKQTIKDFNKNIDQKISEKNKSKMQENTK